jgi:IS30 family transposase
VGRTTGNNWARGYKVYRRGVVVGFAPALERLAVRQISQRFLSQDERIEIADLRQAGSSTRQIARRLGRAPSTISRELPRNPISIGGYRPFEAHRRATARRARHHRRRIETNPELRQLISESLPHRWSPQQISRHLRRRFPGEPAMWLCHASIYQAVSPSPFGIPAPVKAGTAASITTSHRPPPSPRAPARRAATATV